MATIDLTHYLGRLEGSVPIQACGRVVNVVGLTIEATGPEMKIGDFCYVQPLDGGARIPVEVVGFRGGLILLMPLGEISGIGPNSTVIPTHSPSTVRVGPELLGRVINALGEPMDGGPGIHEGELRPLAAQPPKPLDRRRITEAMATGVRSIDTCLTCGKGQRVGIMSGSGVGKSKLMGMIARNTAADVNVIALVGERGREVRDFIEVDLGPEGLARSIVIVATSDEPALMRIKGAYLATAVAEYFRDQGADVLLLMDSITRFAMAQREVGLAVGEPPTTKGYPPSVYSLLPKLVERAGTAATGSITGLYTVLVEGDDMNDPIGDAVRSVVDGHIVLSRDLAERGHYPAVDVLESVSRVMPDVVAEDRVNLAVLMRQHLSTYRDAQDLVNIGAYVSGSNAEIDTALGLMPGIRAFLQQGLTEASAWDDLPRIMASVVGSR
jgi:flagellum-specific ATP synthase